MASGVFGSNAGACEQVEFMCVTSVRGMATDL